MARNTFYQDEIVKDKFNAKQLFRVMRYSIPYKATFILIFILLLVSVAISLVPPLLIKQIIDNVAPSKSVSQLLYILAGFIFIAIADITISFCHQKIMSKTGHKIIAKIRSDIFNKLQDLPLDFFDNRPAGKIVVRVTSYVDELANFFANTLLSFLVSILRILIVTIFMFSLDVKLTLVILSAMIPLGIGVFLITGALKRQFRTIRAKDANRTAFMVESIQGLEVIKSFNRAESNTKIYDRVQEEAKNSWIKAVKIAELNTPVVEIFWNYGFLMIYGVSIALIASGNLLVGTVIAFTNYLNMFNGPLSQLANIIQQFTQVSSNLERIFETMDTKNDITDIENPIELKEVKGNISFKNVDFAYEEGINILENFNLEVTQGQNIALVGPTGAGKSTIINMITRFYDCSKGEVLIDGVNVKDISLHSLRKSIGTMMQDTFIFKGTVMDNIRYGRPGASDEECIASAKAIHADDFIERLPNKYMTELPEKGEGLSSGEKQLLSFARLMLKDPKIVILDEATSSIDSATEEKIQKALHILLKGRTAFLVAHRLSTIKQADRILVISDKGIKESGTHKELMAKKGLYYSLNTIK